MSVKKLCAPAVEIEIRRAIRVGLSHVGGVAAKSVESIVENRKVKPYSSVADFLARSGVEPAEAESLAVCGALDSLADVDGRRMSRPELVWQVKLCGAEAATVTEPLLNIPSFRRRGQHHEVMPGWCSNENSSRTLLEPVTYKIPQLDDYTLTERMEIERETLGFNVIAHPLILFRDEARRHGAVPAKELGDRVGQRVTVFGWLVTSKRTRTYKGDYMKFLTMEDETDIFEVTLFPKPYARYGHILSSRNHGPYIVTGTVDEDGGDVMVNGERVGLV